ncbi:hypothetical protein SERLA73DRAFT_157474 [Serpula lacrymans var. lacrymans S7.3]|uniref:Uncharacterized protein n=1 Tax=Serpula lacrymans var. lacrymans (strain S7.3) TaxID=936435 RepID=F8QJ77_SERL3|nr:hypothetical protein SERLA73DRAFT_157474 [Serpula lacrymans var. lacrymans S7.3]
MGRGYCVDYGGTAQKVGIFYTCISFDPLFISIQQLLRKLKSPGSLCKNEILDDGGKGVDGLVGFSLHFIMHARGCIMDEVGISLWMLGGHKKPTIGLICNKEKSNEYVVLTQTTKSSTNLENHADAILDELWDGLSAFDVTVQQSLSKDSIAALVTCGEATTARGYSEVQAMRPQLCYLRCGGYYDMGLSGHGQQQWINNQREVFRVYRIRNTTGNMFALACYDRMLSSDAKGCLGRTPNLMVPWPYQ